MSAYLPKIDDYILDDESLQQAPRPPPKKRKKRSKAPGSRHFSLPTHEEVGSEEEDEQDDVSISQPVGAGAQKEKGGKNRSHVVPLPEIRKGPAQKRFPHSPPESSSSSSPSQSASGSRYVHFTEPNPNSNNNKNEMVRKDADGLYKQKNTPHESNKRVALGSTDNESNVKASLLQHSHLQGEFHDALSPFVSPKDSGSVKGAGAATLTESTFSPRDGLIPKDVKVSRQPGSNTAARKQRLKRTLSRFLDKTGVSGLGADGSYRGPLTTPVQARQKFSQAIQAVISIRKLAAIMIKK